MNNNNTKYLCYINDVKDIDFLIKIYPNFLKNILLKKSMIKTVYLDKNLNCTGVASFFKTEKKYIKTNSKYLILQYKINQIWKNQQEY